MVSLSQATEAGTIYRVDEIRRLAEIAHAHGLAVHVDGARLSNALARMNASPADATWRAGVDVLSFGATKGGALAAEAVVFFEPARAAGMSERRKRGGQLISKHRFVAAQFEAFFADDLWLTLARHANAMADRLTERLTAVGIVPIWPVEANEVFVVLSARIDRRLRACGSNLLPVDGARASWRPHIGGGRDAGPSGDVVRHPSGRGRSFRRGCAFRVMPPGGQSHASIPSNR